jgi:hypothetical protein
MHSYAALAEERAHHDRHADALLVLDSRSLSPQICGMSLPPAYLRQKLTQPLPTKNGAVLRTIGEAANYVLAPRLIGPRALQSLAARREAPTRPSRRC